MTAGEILVKLIKAKMAGEDTDEMRENLQKATCQQLSMPGSKVVCGDYESSDGGPVKKRT